MRVLLCHRFFWPDTPPYASMLRAIGAHLVRRGHDVTVFSAQPSYRPGAHVAQQPAQQVLDGIRVRRTSLIREKRKDTVVRGTNALLFSARLFLHLLFGRSYEVVTVSTFPPVVLGAAACLACKLRGYDFIYHCMDIHPEVSINTSGKTVGPWLRVLRRIDAWTCRNATRVVVLSADMRQTIRSRPRTEGLDVRVINNFELPAFEDSVVEAEVDKPETHDKSPHVLRVLFAGNAGRFQGLESVVRAAALVDRDLIQVTLMGDGVMKPVLVRLARELGCTNVQFVSFRPPKVARKAMEQSDFGLVTLARGMYRVAYPSKTMTYLKAGCPLIVLVEKESQLASEVIENRLGYVVPAQEPASLAAVLREAYDHRHEWRSARSRLRNYAAATTAPEVAFGQWDKMLAGLESERR